ncbi:MAG: hypothetical protein Q4B93_05305 [Clostridia bacterium]|nr:hypothetical protein [Clostridia bacterium]
MAFEGIQDLWYTLRGELDKESKNLIKEATGHKVDNLVELAEIGMSIYSGKVASKKIAGKLGEESEKLSGLLKKTRKPVSIATRTKRLVKKFMPKKRYRKFKVVDIEELARKQCLKPNIQLFAEEIKSFKLVSPYELEVTHKTTLSKGKLLKLTNDIKLNGIKNSVKYVVYNGKKYIVDGHHRIFVAKKLGIKNVLAEEVQLPYAGYKTVEDLLWVD